MSFIVARSTIHCCGFTPFNSKVYRMKPIKPHVNYLNENKVVLMQSEGLTTDATTSTYRFISLVQV